MVSIRFEVVIEIHTGRIAPIGAPANPIVFQRYIVGVAKFIFLFETIFTYYNTADRSRVMMFDYLFESED